MLRKPMKSFRQLRLEKQASDDSRQDFNFAVSPRQFRSSLRTKKFEEQQITVQPA